ncbi:MAG TPA: hypothetical protein VGK99_12580, partial [Acidobacteriota bacterium]
ILNAEFEMRNVEFGMGNAECGMRNAEWGMGNAECGIGSWEYDREPIRGQNEYRYLFRIPHSDFRNRKWI